MATRRKLGKVIKKINGYKIRQMGGVKSDRFQGKDRQIFKHNGKYGVYTGRKKFIKGDFDNIQSAEEFILSK